MAMPNISGRSPWLSGPRCKRWIVAIAGLLASLLLLGLEVAQWRSDTTVVVGTRSRHA
jgi:hypothetical protein